MKTLFKILAAIVGLVVIAVVAAAIIVPIYFDPNDHKDEIAQAVKEHTGRELKIPGDIALSVFPWLAIDLGVVELGNAPGFPEPLFARLDRMSIGVKLMPLLKKRVEMRTVTVHGLVLNLARDQQGRTNWSDLVQDKPGEKRTESGQIAALGIGGLDIRDATLRWHDAQSGQTFKVQNLTARTGALSLDAPSQPVGLEISFDVAATEPEVTGRVSLETTLQGDPVAQSYLARDLRLTINLAGNGLPGKALDVDLGAQVAADLAAQTLAVDDLKLAVAELGVGGELRATGILQAPRFTGQLKVDRFSPRELMSKLGQEIETADAHALQAAELAASFQGTADSIRLQPLAVTLDDTRLDGTLAVTSFKTLALRFDLSANAIDADRYLPPPAQGGAAAPATTPGTAASAAGALPLDALRALDVDGKASLGKLTVAKLRLSDIAVAIKAKEGLIRVKPIQAKLYEGSYSGNVVMDARGRQAKVSVDEALTGVQAGPLLKDLQGKDVLTGTTQLNMALHATGATPEDFKKTLNGESKFIFRDGAIKGINIPGMIRKAKAALTGAGVADTGPQQTDFAELSGSVQFTNGIGTNKDLSLKSPLLRLAGDGTADLVQEQIDYLAKVTLVGTLEGQGGKELTDLAGIPIPIRIKGPFDKPSIAPDLGSVLESQAKAALEEKVEAQKSKVKEKVKEKLEKSLGDKLEGELKGIFKQ